MTEISEYGKTGNKDFDDLIFKAKEIERKLAVDVATRYRQIGLLLQEYSYKHSIEARHFRKTFMDTMQIKYYTYSTLIQLGRMTEDQFNAFSITFRTIYNFRHKLPVSEGVKEYRREKAASQPKTQCYCDQGNPTFSASHCCVFCQYYKKRKTMVLEQYKKGN